MAIGYRIHARAFDPAASYGVKLNPKKSERVAFAPEDRVIVRMRFWEGESVADIARALGLPQKPLYRRLERTLAALRRSLEAAGVSQNDTASCLAEWVA